MLYKPAEESLPQASPDPVVSAGKGIPGDSAQ